MSRFSRRPRGADGDDFYVGYLPAGPDTTMRFVRQVVLAVAIAASAAAFFLAFFQGRFDQGFFDFANHQQVAGTLELRPVPLLVPADGSEPRLLVAPGKHGFDPHSVASGTSVIVTATSIDAPAGRMLEVVDVERSGTVPPLPGTAEVGETVVLIGEVVDSKCFLGAMKPGRGKTHRSCASLCIRGGVPAGLLVRRAEGSQLFVLIGRQEAEQPLGPTLLDYVGEPVRVEGLAFEQHGQWFLRTQLSRISRWR